MRFNITDQIISDFASGLIPVVAVIAVGALISFLLQGIAGKLPFIRIALIVALAPLSLVNFLGTEERTALIYYAVVTSLFGIMIDGINHLLQPRERTVVKAEPRIVEEERPEIESRPGVIVWEKAE
jgi:hypothetical protein